ncbi:hypothetical protein, partial [Micromonospora ureilytica]|uniref:hypothetical protein n=1 Tax=Micromonospora ureilytica TaxID=709868 RepID=UPI00197B3A92
MSVRKFETVREKCPAIAVAYRRPRRPEPPVRLPVFRVGLTDVRPAAPPRPAAPAGRGGAAGRT